MRRLVIRVFTTLTSIKTAAVTELLLIERTDLFKRPLNLLETFVGGFTVFLRDFIDILEDRLIRDSTIVIVLVTTTIFFYDFYIFLRSNAVAVLFYLSSSF